MTACLNHPENGTKKVLLHAWWYHPQMLGSRHWPKPVSEEASTWPMTFPAQNWVNFNDILPWIFPHIYIYMIYIYKYVFVCDDVIQWSSCCPIRNVPALISTSPLSWGETSVEFEHRRYPLDVYFQSVSEWLFLGCTEAVMHWALVGNEFKSRISTQQIPAVSQWLGF